MAGFHTKTFKIHDDYMTPKYAWENIIEYIPNNKIIWEAFFGDGESGTYLKELGFNTIHEPIDFFNDDTLPEYDLIISNPPFSEAKKVMDRLYKLDKPFILIMPSAKINTSYFRNWKNKNLQIIIPRKRIQFIKLEEGKVNDAKKCCNFDCFYYCYKMDLEKDIIWLE